MADNEKKILVDDDWKSQARREKEQLSQQQTPGREALPAPAFAEIVNLIVMQAMAGLGMLAAPGGQRIPPDLEVAKHFIDLLRVLEDKTKNNLAAEEKKLVDEILYEMQMRYVQMAGGMPSAGG